MRRRRKRRNREQQQQQQHDPATTLSLIGESLTKLPFQMLAEKGTQTLTHLILYDNDLSAAEDTLLLVLGTLPSLLHLNLASNGLSSSFLAGLLSVPAAPTLTSLDLSHNALSGPLPRLLDSLSSLSSLRLNGNDVTALHPDERTEDAPALSYLHLGASFTTRMGNGMSRTIQSALTSLPHAFLDSPSLAHVYLNNQQLRSLDPAGISSHCVALSKLIVSNNQLSHLPPVLALLPSLTWLDASKNIMTDLPLFLAHSSSLRRLSLVKNDFEDSKDRKFTNHHVNAQLLHFLRNHPDQQDASDGAPDGPPSSDGPASSSDDPSILSGAEADLPPLPPPYI